MCENQESNKSIARPKRKATKESWSEGGTRQDNGVIQEEVRGKGSART